MATALRISACLVLAGACAPTPWACSQRVELASAENGRELDTKEYLHSCLLELDADGTLVGASFELPAKEWQADREALAARLARLATKDTTGVTYCNFSRAVPVHLRIDQDASFEDVAFLTSTLRAFHLGTGRNRVAVRGKGNKARWLDLANGHPSQDTLAEHVEVRTLDVSAGQTIVVWWLERLPGTTWSPDRARSELRTTSFQALRTLVDPEVDRVYVHASSGTRWSDVVEVLDLLASKSLTASFSPLGDEG